MWFPNSCPPKIMCRRINLFHFMVGIPYRKVQELILCVLFPGKNNFKIYIFGVVKK